MIKKLVTETLKQITTQIKTAQTVKGFENKAPYFCLLVLACQAISCLEKNVPTKNCMSLIFGLIFDSFLYKLDSQPPKNNMLKHLGEIHSEVLEGLLGVVQKMALVSQDGFKEALGRKTALLQGWSDKVFDICAKLTLASID